MAFFLSEEKLLHDLQIILCYFEDDYLQLYYMRNGNQYLNIYIKVIACIISILYKFFTKIWSCCIMEFWTNLSLLDLEISHVLPWSQKKSIKVGCKLYGRVESIW